MKSLALGSAEDWVYGKGQGGEDWHRLLKILGFIVMRIFIL